VLEALDLPPGQVALVGDQLFTDVLAAKRLGLYARDRSAFRSTSKPSKRAKEPRNDDRRRRVGA